MTRDPDLKAAIDRSIKHLTEKLIREIVSPDGSEMAFLIEEDDEIKLGGNGVALLALTRHALAFDSREHVALMEKIALGIRYMQNADGSFRHVLRSSDLTVKQEFRTIYYEGEAAFGLMRLYDLTKDRRWILMVEMAFEHFLRNDHWRHHDHWLSYCVNELTRYRPDSRYFQFGLRNVSGYLDFVATRITTFPTLLELMMAAREMLSRIAADPVHQPLLTQIDLGAFLDALERRALYLLNGHFWPELAMYFAKPDRIVGSFFIRHHAFRVRIDDVEHYLSGLIAYGRYLPQRAAFAALVARHGQGLHASEGSNWSAGGVASATGGDWIVPPGPGWTATGLCTYKPAYEAGNLVVVRTAGTRGVRPEELAELVPPPSGLITDHPGSLADHGLPMLSVANIKQAVIGLGEHARGRLEGRVVGVTGSAGKTTTTAMMAHALSVYGSTAQTREGANLPVGVAWNLASVPRDTSFVVLEMAIGSMRQSAGIARPNVVLFTNILPSHLIYHGDTATIARKKSAIFLGMEAGGVAVLNRDMLEFPIVREAAVAREVRVLTYGTSEEADLRLLSYDEATGGVVARLQGREAEWSIGSGGVHTALNSLAVAGGVIALGLPLEPLIGALDSFVALPGRGQVVDVEFDGRGITIIDDAYNANPGSMAAALTRLSALAMGRRTVAVLGQMAELGPDEEGYHTDLAGLVSRLGISQVHVMGPLYARFWDTIPSQARGSHVGSLEQLQRMLLEHLRDGDLVLIKGSNATGMQKVVSWIKGQA